MVGLLHTTAAAASHNVPNRGPAVLQVVLCEDPSVGQPLGKNTPEPEQDTLQVLILTDS